MKFSGEIQTKMMKSSQKCLLIIGVVLPIMESQNQINLQTGRDIHQMKM